jgi:hypothetical protein
MSPHFQKRSNKKCCKRSHYVAIQSQENQQNQRSHLYQLQNFHKLLFLLPKWIMKNNIIIRHQTAEPEKVVQQ